MPAHDTLTPLEHLLLVDRRPGYPMAFYIHCDVEGALSPERLAAALRSAAARHALPRSRVGGWWRPRWLKPDRDPEFVAIAHGSAGTGPDPWSPATMHRSSGMRLIALEGRPDSWRVVLQVQHAVCDGLAAIEFLGDVWAHYHGSQPAPFRSSEHRLRDRADVETPVGAGAARTGTESISAEAPRSVAAEAGRFATFLPAVLARGPAVGHHAPAGPGPTAWPGPPAPYITLSFDAAQTAAFKRRAAAAGASLNDIVVGAVMRVAHAWNHAAGLAPRSVRITMPVSLKPAGTRGPARNDMSYAFLDRSADECRHPAPLVRSLAAASRWIQETRAAELFLTSLSSIDRVPGLVRLLTRLPLPLATAVVSYVGNAGPRMRANLPRDGGCDLPGGLRITAVAGVPPVRPGTRLAVGLVLYDGRLQLSTLCDTRALGPAAAPLLAELIRAEVLAVADALPAAPNAG
ncbi:MAG: hypothetical protein ACK6CT_14135 [Planctomycetia bacterium]